jgi:AcrR family transcriptional regulator/DNA-binding MarR family transcriptional regulator
MAPAVTAPDPGDAPAVQARRNTQSYGLPTQRDRLVAATGELAAELGSSAIGVHHICQRAGISRRTFYDLYVDRDACFVDVHQEAFGRLLGHVTGAVAESGDEWEDRAVAVVHALLGAWEADRVLAYLCVIASVGGGRGQAMALRRTAIAQIAGLLVEAPEQPLAVEPALAGVLGSVWELALRGLTENPSASLADLSGTGIYLALSPFVGRRQAAARAAGRGGTTAYVTRWTPAVPGNAEDRGLLVTELTGQTLRYLNGHPGAANIDIARAVDVRHESQMSRHLGRLEKAGMVSRRKEGRTNAWCLTARGEEAARTLRDLRADAPRLTNSTWSVIDHKEA